MIGFKMNRGLGVVQEDCNRQLHATPKEAGLGIQWLTICHAEGSWIRYPMADYMPCIRKLDSSTNDKQLLLPKKEHLMTSNVILLGNCL